MKKFLKSVSGLFASDPDKIGQDGFTRLQRAIRQNDLPKVMKLVAAGASLNFRGQMVCPPLHFALEKDRHSIAVALVNAGADIDLQDAHGRTPLFHATQQGQDRIVRLLLGQHANPNIADRHSRAPLHVVSPACPDLAADLVARGARRDARDEQGDTALHKFINNPQMVKALLDCGVNPNVPNNQGLTPFQIAMDDRHIEKYPHVLPLFLSSRADFDTHSPHGETILHLCARLNRRQEFDVVLARCNLEARDSEGNNVLHILARTQNIDLVTRVLFRAPQLLQQPNHQGLTPVGELARMGYKHALYLTEGQNKLEAIARTMLLNGGGVNDRDNKGNTLAHLAVQGKRAEFLSFLISRGADLDIRNHDGKAPLQLAVDDKNLRLVDTLLDHNADPDLPDDSGWTLLDRLAEKGDRDSSIVQRLIVAGGQYKKQLPLNPDVIRPRAGGPHGNDNADDRKAPLGKPVVVRRPDGFKQG